MKSIGTQISETTVTPRFNFDDIYEKHHLSVYALCRRLVSDEGEAEDATQETFLAVAIGLPRFRGESTIATWIHRIAIRSSLKVRNRYRNNYWFGEDKTDSIPDTTQYFPVDSMRLTKAIGMLTYEHRLVLALFSITGFSHQEISDVLAIPEGTVWSRLHAAKKKIAALLGATESI